MKKSFLIFPALFVFPLAAMADEGRAHIPHEIPDGTPPPPQEPKPVWIVPAGDVIAERNFIEGGRKITVREILPIDLPPPPKPTAPVEMSDELRERIREYQDKHPRHQTICLGATVYKLDGGVVRTHFHVWGIANDGEYKPMSFWSSGDFSHLSGIGAFTDKEGETRALFMVWGIIDVPRFARLHADNDSEYNPPEVPELPDGEAAFVVAEGQPDEELLAAVHALHEILNHDAAELKTAYEGRENARREREEYLNANPPQPKDIIINHWKIERKEEGGDQ